MNARRLGLFSKSDLWAAAGLTGLLVHYARLLPRLPDPVPTHFNVAGIPNGWTSKTYLPLVVFAAPATNPDAPRRSAPVKVALVRVALTRLTFVRLALLKLALVNFP